MSILLIISFHYVYKSGYVYTDLNFNTIVVKVFYLFGELGVNLFILITGYFMINGEFKPKKLILILIEVLFYYLLTIFIGRQLGAFKLENNFKTHFLMFFPTITNRYWFITVYVIIYILSPYLNILARNMSNNEFKNFLKTILILWCVIPTLFGVFYDSTETLLYYSRFIWLIVMYFVGGYIRLYGFKYLNTSRKKLICAVISFVIMVLFIGIIHMFRDMFSELGLKEISYFWTPNNIPMFLLSISIFGLFLSFKIKSIKIINILASTTLGIYIMHDGLLNKYLWTTIFKTKEHLSSEYSIIHIFIATIIIFIVCAVIDLIRQIIEKYTIKKFLYSGLYEKIFENKIKPRRTP